jgi:uncharacterized peroxidase-related enzyme
MTFIRTIGEECAPDDVKAMYERQHTKFGYLPNYAGAFSHRPEVMKRWADLQAEIRGHLTPRRFELVTLAAAHALRSSYCSLAHGQALLRHVPDGDLRAILNDESGHVSEAERAMMRFAGKVARDPSRVTAGDVAQLEAHGLTDAEIFDIVATVAARAFFATVLDALGVEPDAAYLKLDEPVRALLTVGRPIAFK